MQVNRRQALATLSIFGVALAVYLSFLTAYYSYDAVASGILLYQWVALGRVEQLFHHYHVLYLPTAAVVERALGAVGIEIDPLTLLQLLGAPFAAGSVAIYYLLARVIGLRSASSTLCTLLFAGGFGFWSFATGGESYPIAMFFLLLAFLSAARATPESGAMRWLASGVSLGLAVGFHGTSVLALPGLCVLAWARARVRRSAIACTVLAVVAVVGLAYAARYAIVRASGRSASVATDASTLAAEGWSIPPKFVVEWRALAESMAPSDQPQTPTRHPGLARAAFAGLLAMTLLPLVLAVRSDRIGRDAAIALAVWLAAAFTFFSMYYPGNSKFVSIQWAPLLLLIGLATEQLAAWPRAHRVVLALLAMLTVATVVLGFDLVRSQSRPDSNPHLSRARAIARVTQPDDLVVHLGTGDDRYQNVYARYFAGRRPLSLQECAAGTGGGESALRAIEAHVASAIGRGRVVVLDDAITHSPPTVFFERQHGIPEGSITRLLGAHGPVRIADDPASGPLWLLTR